MRAYTVIRKERKILTHIEIKDGLVRIGKEYPGNLVAIPFLAVRLNGEATYLRVGKKGESYVLTPSPVFEDKEKVLVLIKGEPSNPEFFLTYGFKVFKGETIAVGTGYLLYPIPCLYNEGLVILELGGHIEVEDEPPFVIYFNDEIDELCILSIEEWKAYKIRRGAENIEYI